MEFDELEKRDRGVTYPITYGDLVRALYKLSNKWMMGKDWERLGQKYDDFCTGFDEAQQEDAIVLLKLLEKTGIEDEQDI